MKMKLEKEQFSTSESYLNFWRENMKFWKNGKEIEVEDLPPCKFVKIFSF